MSDPRPLLSPPARWPAAPPRLAQAMTAAPASPQQIRDRLLQAIDPQSNVSTRRAGRDGGRMGPGPSLSSVTLSRRARGYPPDAHLPPRAAAIPACRPLGPGRRQVGQPGGARYVRPRLPCGLGGGSRRELGPEHSLLFHSSPTTLAPPDGSSPASSFPGDPRPPGSLPSGRWEGRKAVEQLVSGV